MHARKTEAKLLYGKIFTKPIKVPLKNAVILLCRNSIVHLLQSYFLVIVIDTAHAENLTDTHYKA